MAIVGADVLVETADAFLPRQTVIVEGNRIERIGPESSLRVPFGARRIDGRGRFLIPGLADLHVHLRSPQELETYLRYGVTTIAHTGGPEAGAPDLISYRTELKANRMSGPTLFVAGRLLDGADPIFPRLAVAVPDVASARRVVMEQKQAGYDFVKTYNFLDRDVYIDIVRTAHAVSMPVIGHVPQAVDIDTALETGHDLFLHVSDFLWRSPLYDRKTRQLRDDGDEIVATARAAAAAKTAVAPTLIAARAMLRKIDDRAAVLSDPRMGELAPQVAKLWRDDTYTSAQTKTSFPLSQKMTGALYDAGVLLVVGTDAALFGVFPGKAVHDEMQELVNAGLPPAAALAAATRNPGQLMQHHFPNAPRFGAIRPGHQADLVLLRANPLIDIGHTETIEGVMVRGRWLPD